MKKLVQILGLASTITLSSGAYSQTEKYVNIEKVERKSRELENAAKNFGVSSVYTNPTSIPFDSLDSKTKNRVWQMLSNQYEIKVEQYENALKDYEACQKENLQKEEALKLLNEELDKLKKENGELKKPVHSEEDKPKKK